MSRLAQLETLHSADAGDADVMYMIAQEHAKGGGYALAVSWYDRCLGADAGYVYAYFHKARAQQAADDLPAAIATARAGLSRARELGQAKAQNELASLIDELEP